MEDDSSKGEGLLLEEDEDGTIHSDGYDQWHEGETVEVYIEEARPIAPGTKEICRAVMNSRHQTEFKRSYATKRVEVKLDSYGSVSIGHSSLLTNIKFCKEYRISTVTLKGIGGKTEPLTQAGILKHVLPNGRMVKWLCYVFDTPVGQSLNCYC